MTNQEQPEREDTAVDVDDVRSQALAITLYLNIDLDNASDKRDLMEWLRLSHGEGVFIVENSSTAATLLRILPWAVVGERGAAMDDDGAAAVASLVAVDPVRQQLIADHLNILLTMPEEQLHAALDALSAVRRGPMQQEAPDVVADRRRDLSTVLA